MVSAARGRLIAVIGDEDTVVGFLLGGIGELDRSRRPNFLVRPFLISVSTRRGGLFQTVDKNTSVSEIEEAFKAFTNREDIAIVLINQHIAEMIRHVVDEHRRSIPAVLEIPSKEHPYDPSKVRD